MVDLVIVQAKAGTRPAAGTDRPHPRPLYAPNGRPSVMMPAIIEDVGGVAHETLVPTQALRGGVYRAEAFCPLVYEPDPQLIVSERAEYAVWHAALRILAEELAGELQTIAVLSPSAPARPWLGERDSGKPGILQDLSAVFTRQQAERAAAERRQGKRRVRPAVGAGRRPAEAVRNAASA